MNDLLTRSHRAVRLLLGGCGLAVSAVAFALMLFPPGLSADSLWQRRIPERASLVSDTKALRVGDIVTILISESTAVDNREDTELNRQTSSSGVFDLSTSVSGGIGSQEAAGEFDLENSSGRGFQGEAAYRDARAFSDRISVPVIDVLPNGNLVLAGERRLEIGGEQRTLTISGIVRPYDIAGDNTVNSRYVSQFRAVYSGTGHHRRFSRQGWFGRAMNFAWPF
jgi:flagellar L-ring protein precursor FlgH